MRAIKENTLKVKVQLDGRQQGRRCTPFTGEVGKKQANKGKKIQPKGKKKTKVCHEKRSKK